MNIFKKALLVALSAGLLSVPSAVNTVEAANTDNSKEKWSAIGTIGGSSWNKDFALAYDATDDRYELEIALTAGNEFKIRLNNAWTTSIGYGGNTGAGISTYLQDSGGNFKVKTTGNYILWVKDDNVRNYGDKSYGFGIDKAAEVVYHTVTHYNEDGTQAKTEQVIENSTYNPTFVEKEGYRLEGWYTDKALTTKFEKGTAIKTDVSLYPKYVEAQDYSIYINVGSAFSKVNVYMWSDAFDGHYNVGWPGASVATKNENGYYKVDVDASKSFDTFIINDGTNQTGNTVLPFEETYFTVTKSGTTYNVSAVKISDLTASANLNVYAQDDGVSKLRVISTLGVAGQTFDLDSYVNVGFKFELNGKTKEVNAGYVYTSVVADGQTISAETLGSHYFYVATFNNVPSGTSLVVTPFATLTNGAVVYGAAQTVGVTY